MEKRKEHREEEQAPKVVPVIEEQLVAGARPVRTGSVRVQKHVERRKRTVQIPLVHESVDVERVPVNRVVDAIPRIRREPGRIIVPVVEEEVIVTKRLILKEELHIIRKRTRERVRQEVTLERERADVQRLDAQGRVIDNSPAPPSKPARRRSVLDR